MTDQGRGIAMVAEIADVLAQHGSLRCAPIISAGDGGLLTLVVTFYAPDTTRAFEVLELQQELQHVADIAQLRALASKYDVDPAALEALLPKER